MKYVWYAFHVYGNAINKNLGKMKTVKMFIITEYQRSELTCYNFIRFKVV